MNLKELYDYGRKALGGESILLTEAFLGADRREIALHPEKVPNDAEPFMRAVEKRKRGVPLQYLLGHWYFDGLKLMVRPGVLIPREDTLALAQAGAQFVGNKPMKGLDLCAGTGAVALSVGRRCPNAEVTAVELYDEPFACLQENIGLWGMGNVKALRGDVLGGPQQNGTDRVDFLLSNPPYIASSQLPFLQKEVQQEPKEALDGGEDGLCFYRVLTEKWSPIVRPGGLMGLEIGDGQQAAVRALMVQNGFDHIRVYFDMGGLPRAITGIKKADPTS